ncbi:hypothetical protein I302_104773 [Kwoniella bestiolae CBS 10118]|uniref:Uncharacterized protein n=1 Tax=Kwoniella bestiolae CBS 10118 TaxID=1296100 RepID=A0A1B9FRT0_9TREE|nr:hypothetical protein I302_09158 [Kwoniella bestiolae CBS 10118]OCF21479.1 hypothetical protein I302_09158 [Kwoniella bestiolae CBS 10118]
MDDGELKQKCASLDSVIQATALEIAEDFRTWIRDLVNRWIEQEPESSVGQYLTSGRTLSIEPERQTVNRSRLSKSIWKSTGDRSAVYSDAWKEVERAARVRSSFDSRVDAMNEGIDLFAGNFTRACEKLSPNLLEDELDTFLDLQNEIVSREGEQLWIAREQCDKQFIKAFSHWLSHTTGRTELLYGDVDHKAIIDLGSEPAPEVVRTILSKATELNNSGQFDRQLTQEESHKMGSILMLACALNDASGDVHSTREIRQLAKRLLPMETPQGEHPASAIPSVTLGDALGTGFLVE